MRFIAELIIGITAVIVAIVSSVVTSSIALVHQIHTANHVNTLSKHVSIALVTKKGIDQGLIEGINALEEAFLFMGDQIQNIKVHLTTACHADF